MRPRPLFAAGLALVMAGLLPSACRARDDTPTDRDDILKAIQPDLAAGKVDDAIAKLDKMAADKPKDRTTLFFLVAVTQQKAMQMAEDRKASMPVFLKSAEAARKLAALSEGEPLPPEMVAPVSVALYNGACSLALDGKAKAALTMLQESVAAGFGDLETMKGDKEIDSLRDLPEFAAVLKAAEANVARSEAKEAEKAVGEVRALFKEHEPFPFRFSLPDLDDKKVSLDDLKGKVVIVDFWGTWCPPCRKEIPHFVDLLKAYKGKGLEIVGINYEDGEPGEVKKVIKDFLAQNKVPYTCVIGDEETRKQVPDFQGYPTTLFLDRTGKVRLRVVGYHAKPVLEEIVKTLLEEKSE